MNTSKNFVNGKDWKIVSFLTAVHLLAALAVLSFFPWFSWFFSWSAIITAIVLAKVTTLAITVGFHRLHTHGSFETKPWVSRTLGAVASLAGQGPPMFWVAFHTKHHAHVEKENDPHTPKRGLLYSHFGWTLEKMTTQELAGLIKRYTPVKLRNDPFMRHLNRRYPVWVAGSALLLFGFGCLMGLLVSSDEIVRMGISMFVWAFCARMVFVYHWTWCVNSVCHVWGYTCKKALKDDSTNNLIVAAFTDGEGFHNNHHAYPTLARFWQGRWEKIIDFGYMAICVLEKLKLVWNVNREIPDKAE